MSYLDNIRMTTCTIKFYPLCTATYLCNVKLVKDTSKPFTELLILRVCQAMLLECKFRSVITEEKYKHSKFPESLMLTSDLQLKLSSDYKCGNYQIVYLKISMLKFR